MDLRVGRTDMAASYWTVMADVAIAMFVILALHFIVQFLENYQEQYVNRKLEERQEEVERAVRDGLTPEFSGTIEFESRAPNRQLITFSSDVLFAVCRADLTRRGADLLDQLGDVLRGKHSYFEAIDVWGHTDRRPIADLGTCLFPSNWELSSARATTVVRLLAGSSQIPPRKLSAVGWAEFHPVDATALDPNRRIEVHLTYDRYQLEAELREPSAAGS